MLSYWKTLPEPLRNMLLENSSGKLHLMELADISLAAAAQAGSSNDAQRLIRLGFDTILAAWENELLDGEIAGHLAKLAQGRAWLPEPLLQAALSISSAWQKPENLGYLQRLQERGDRERLWRYIETQLTTKEPGNLFWLQQALSTALFQGDTEGAEKLLETEALSQFEGLRLRLLGECRFLSGDYEAAVDILQQSSRKLPLPGSIQLWAEALLRLGSRDTAMGMFMDCLKLRPWQTNLLLKAHDLYTDADKELVEFAGDTAVLIYTYNKAQDVDRTLEALFDSRLNGARVLALDNGSEDDTAQVLAAWKDRAGGCLDVVSLPVNVGAPAARNWLLHHESVTHCRYVAFLDDDALVPEDWLLRLGSAVKRYPQAGVWGCRIVDAALPAVLQSVDLYLEDAGVNFVSGGEGRPPLRHFLVSNYHMQSLDHGLFTYLRPCASVTGCCHLFESSRLKQVGDFDLWFSPSQLDDLDRDIRMLGHELPAVYQGHLTVRHLKRSGKAAYKDPREWGNAQGNQAKLQLKHSPEDIARAKSLVSGWLWNDLQAKLAGLRENAS